jgi:hypothetical protein
MILIAMTLEITSGALPSGAASAPAKPDQGNRAKPPPAVQKPDSLALFTLWAGRAATPATEPDWNGALAMPTQFKDDPQGVERERATLDKLQLNRLSDGRAATLVKAKREARTAFGDEANELGAQSHRW